MILLSRDLSTMFIVLLYWDHSVPSASNDLRASTWLVTENGPAESCHRRSPLVEGWRKCVSDWHVMDAGPSNSIRPLICLLGLSCLSASALRNGKLTQRRLGLAG